MLAHNECGGQAMLRAARGRPARQRLISTARVQRRTIRRIIQAYYYYNVLYTIQSGSPVYYPTLRPIGPNNLTGAMAGVFFASLCIVAPSTSPIMHIRSTPSQSAVDAPPAPSGAGGSCVSGARVFQHDAGVPRSPT